MPTLRINEENENLMHYITITVIEWIDIFTKLKYFEILSESLSYCRKNKGLLLYDFVFMSNHIHLIVRAKEGNKLSRIIADFKQFTTKNILKELKSDNRRYILNLIKNSFNKKKGIENQVWQRENYPVPICSEKFYFEKAGYIIKNPVRKNYVEKAEDWVYSSAKKRLFDEVCVIELDDPFA
jgi:REP element-mobilizing transposase RayT